MRVEQHGEAIGELAGVPPHFLASDGGIALHRVNPNAAGRIRLLDAVHLRRIAVAQGAIRGDEEEHYGARLSPLVRAVRDAFGVAQGKLDRGMCQG